MQEQFTPMTDEQRQRWKQSGLFPIERWGQGGPGSTPLICPLPTHDELRALATSVPEYLQLSGWYAGKERFGRQFIYADNFSGMGRQWLCDFRPSKPYFAGLVDYVAAVHPRTVLRLLDRITDLEARIVGKQTDGRRQDGVPTP